GVWKVTKSNVSGVAEPLDVYKKVVFTIEGDKATLKEPRRNNFPISSCYGIVDGRKNGDFYRDLVKDDTMPFSPEVEQAVKTLYRSLREKDRRRYAAVEAAKLGHGGVEYIAGLLHCDPKTIRRGR